MLLVVLHAAELTLSLLDTAPKPHDQFAFNQTEFSFKTELGVVLRTRLKYGRDPLMNVGGLSRRKALTDFNSAPNLAPQILISSSYLRLTLKELKNLPYSGRLSAFVSDWEFVSISRGIYALESFP